MKISPLALLNHTKRVLTCHAFSRTATDYITLTKEAQKKRDKMEIFSVSILDIKKALEIEIKQTPAK